MIAGDLDLDDVIWTDECSVQLESHHKTAYYEQGEPFRMVSRPKHPHVWAGISARGATSVVINPRRMRRRVTVLTLCVCVCVFRVC